MTSPAPKIYLSDYTAPAFLVDTVELTFKLSAKNTRVISRISFRPNPDSQSNDFFLHGEHLKLLSAKIDGQIVSPDVSETGLTCTVPDAPFIWECEVEIAPADNTALEGLYMSNGMYCTQCEAEGFRRITYYPDRPDVMATFKVRIESDLPVLLSNGNPTGRGDGWAEWDDPWPKPAYLFALVAGDLLNHPDSFCTKSGKDVELNIWVRPDDIGKCAFGMQALKLSMKWDEDVYGREYDLDIFNIVAVDDFNMGAMENKGLNIFNSSCVLASPQTSTDASFERIEAIIAHEYFHNWTGNRITCRDWFQLCLKEGLTVFRDQSFTSDMRGAAVKRIKDVLQLRGRQFREDQGPLSHPVRPDSFVEINNFYTATIYEKGAEVIGMLKRLVGDKAYAKALDLYFKRHDGQACTIEDWLKVFEDTTGRDLSQFKRWYEQAGTPRLDVRDEFRDGVYRLHFEQATPPTPGQDVKYPQVLPIAVGLLDKSGAEIQPTVILEMTEAAQSFSFAGLTEKPVPSILRGFSAPVVLNYETDNARRSFLLAHDTDPFNKWEAGRDLTKNYILAMITDGAKPAQNYLDILAKLANDDALDPAFRAITLQHPGNDELSQDLFAAGITPDPQKIYDTLVDWTKIVANHIGDDLYRLHSNNIVTGPYSPDAKSVGKRKLQAMLQMFISRLDGGDLARETYAKATNMSQKLSAMNCLLGIGQGQPELGAFYQQWSSDRLVIDTWFSTQALQAPPQKAAKIVRDLTQHADFDHKNPNRFRALIGGLSMNTAGFHDPTGASYELVADWLIKLDPLNPQTTARMSSAFQSWKRYDKNRQDLMRTQMQRILASPNLSGDTNEMLSRMLKA